MADSNDSTDPLAGLREALSVSPDNLPLRRHLAAQLLAANRVEEAEGELRRALRQAPGDATLKIELARCFDRRDKRSEAIVVLEDAASSPDCPAAGRVLFAKLLLRAGEVERAVHQYKRALDDDPAAADPELADALGVRPPGQFDADDDDDRRFIIDGRVRSAGGDDDGAATAEIERPKITFDDVGGLDDLKGEVRMKIIAPLENAELFKAYGKKTGGGILMYGPPGCGKTHLARATAGTISSRFMSVGISDVLDMWIGNSEKNLAALFDQARRNRPCVLFFDEVDALAASRSDMRQSGGRHLINQFLAEMDGADKDNDGLLILAATNAPWHVDPAFRRPGRFDRVLFVPPPDAPARAAILKAQLKGKPVEAVDYDKIAKKSDGFSGADLKAIVDVAIEAKLAEAMKAGVSKPITTKDLLARRRHRPPQHPRVVRHREEPRPVRQPRRGVRRHTEVPEAVGWASAHHPGSRHRDEFVAGAEAVEELAEQFAELADGDVAGDVEPQGDLERLAAGGRAEVDVEDVDGQHAEQVPGVAQSVRGVGGVRGRAAGRTEVEAGAGGAAVVAGAVGGCLDSRPHAGPLGEDVQVVPQPIRRAGVGVEPHEQREPPGQVRQPHRLHPAAAVGDVVRDLVENAGVVAAADDEHYRPAGGGRRRLGGVGHGEGHFTRITPVATLRAGPPTRSAPGRPLKRPNQPEAETLRPTLSSQGSHPCSPSSPCSPCCNPLPRCSPPPAPPPKR